MKSFGERIDWEGEYENLRREALGGSSCPGHGLALFVSRGMTAWLEALTALGAPPRQDTPPESVDWAPVWRPDLTTLLANMVLNCLGREEAHEQLQ